MASNASERAPSTPPPSPTEQKNETQNKNKNKTRKTKNEKQKNKKKYHGKKVARALARAAADDGGLGRDVFFTANSAHEARVCLVTMALRVRIGAPFPLSATATTSHLR